MGHVVMWKSGKVQGGMTGEERREEEKDKRKRKKTWKICKMNLRKKREEGSRRMLRKRKKIKITNVKWAEQ